MRFYVFINYVVNRSGSGTLVAKKKIPKECRLGTLYLATEEYVPNRNPAELGFSEPTATLQRPTFRRPIIMDTGGNLATSLGAIALAGWRRVVRGALGGGWRAALPAGPGARARPRGRGPARTGGRRRRAVAQLAVRSGHGPHRGRGCDHTSRAATSDEPPSPCRRVG